MVISLLVKILLGVDLSVLGIFILSLFLIFLFIVCVLDGLMGGNVFVVNVYLLDIFNDINCKVNFGKMVIFISLGFIVGLVLVGFLGVIFYEEFLFVLVVVLIFLMVIFVI